MSTEPRHAHLIIDEDVFEAYQAVRAALYRMNERGVLTGGALYHAWQALEGLLSEADEMDPLHGLPDMHRAWLEGARWAWAQPERTPVPDVEAHSPYKQRVSEKGTE